MIQRKLAKGQPAYALTRENWSKSLDDPTGFYVECVRYFQQKLMPELRAHRAYFHNVPSNRRGFGEDAFHVEWYLLCREFKPETFLEIGVFRGQTVSLAALCARILNYSCEVYGVSPFTPAGDSVSEYRQDLDYLEDTRANFNHFQLPAPNLLRAYSTDPAAIALLDSRKWDMIYIDGNHDYEVVNQDWNNCARNLKPGGIIVLDDAGLHTTFQSPAGLASRGHPGPSKVADEIDRSQFTELLQVGHNRAFQKNG